MQAMELMAIFTEPELVDRANVTPGQRVRLAVRRQNDQLTLLRIERLD